MTAVIAELLMWAAIVALVVYSVALQRDLMGQHAQLRDLIAAQAALARFIGDRVPGELPPDVRELLEVADALDALDAETRDQEGPPQP